MIAGMGHQPREHRLESDRHEVVEVEHPPSRGDLEKFVGNRDAEMRLLVSERTEVDGIPEVDLVEQPLPGA